MTSPLRSVARAGLRIVQSISMAMHRALLSTAPRLRLGENVHIAWSARLYTRTVDGLPRGGSVSIGSRTTVCDGAIIAAYGGLVEVGEDCYIGPYCVLYGHGGLRIGRNSLIAAHTVIITADHIYDDPFTTIAAQGERRRGVEIGDGVWIGSGARILDGVVIGDGAVIGAGAVVNTSIPALAVAVGVPANVIKHRKADRESPCDAPRVRSPLRGP